MFLRFTSGFALVLLAFFFALNTQASETGKLTIEILQKTKSPLHFFSQPHQTPSNFVVLNERDDIKNIRSYLNSPVRCKYDEEFEDRFLDLFSLVCGAIVPAKDAEIVYEHFEDSFFIQKFDDEMKADGWVFTDDGQKMDIVFLIECESTNLLRMNRRPLLHYLGGMKSGTINRYASIIKIVGVKLPGTGSDDIILKAKFEMYTAERLTETALQNAIAKIVPEIKKN